MRSKIIAGIGLLMLASTVNAEEKTKEIKVTEKTTVKTEKPAAAQPAAAQATTPQTEGKTVQIDTRVKEALDRMKLNYAIDERGTFRLLFTVGERRQNVFVDSRVEQFNGLDIRLISSTAYRVEGELPDARAKALLADNARRKIGSWRIASQGGSTYVIYAVQVPADADDNILRAAMAAAMQTADALEKEETGKDEF